MEILKRKSDENRVPTNLLNRETLNIILANPRQLEVILENLSSGSDIRETAHNTSLLISNQSDDLERCSRQKHILSLDVKDMKTKHD